MWPIRAVRVIIGLCVFVIPAHVGIHVNADIDRMDSRLRGNDGHKIRETL